MNSLDPLDDADKSWEVPTNAGDVLETLRDIYMQTLYDTRTKSEDYRIYSDGGRRVFSSSEFQPFYKKAEIDETEECAILYEEQGKIYLVVFMLKRDAKDVATRGLSFSFCQIFLQSELSNALRAFTRIKEEWIAAEAKVSEL